MDRTGIGIYDARIVVGQNVYHCEVTGMNRDHAITEAKRLIETRYIEANCDLAEVRYCERKEETDDD